MLLKVTTNDFIDVPILTQAPPDELVLASDMKYFDKDGYELNETETLYHRYNNVNLSERHLYHTANHTAWFIDEKHSQSNFVLDHSMIMQRWEYGGDAREQIQRLITEKPSLGKLLSVRKKWGLDFSLDFVSHSGVCTEVFHIENDFLTLHEARIAKTRAESLIFNTDWNQVLFDIMSRKSEWCDLCSDDQADWKARLVGWHRAFDNQKVFL